MDAYGSKKMAEEARKKEKRFRLKHRISDAEWERALAMAADLREHYCNEFWRLYDASHSGDDRRAGS